MENNTSKPVIETDEVSDPEGDELVAFLLKWGRRYGYSISLPNDTEKTIDFVQINAITKVIYFDEFKITEPLTDAG